MRIQIVALAFALTAFTAWSHQCSSHKTAAEPASAKPAKACCGTCKSASKAKCEKSACSKSACTKSACTKSACTKSACTKSACTKSKCTKGEAKHTISTEALKKAIEAQEKLVILDARSGKWDDGRRIPGAKQLTAAADAETIKAVVGADKEARIITYCSNLKCGASAKLAKRLQKEGYKNVIEYPNGIAGWAEAGNSVHKGKK